MIKVILKREVFKEKYIIGSMYLDGECLCRTLEPSWKYNKKKSCVALGEYVCEPHKSFKYPSRKCKKLGVKFVWRLRDDMTHRVAILLGHIGNFLKNTNGCILTGEEYLEEFEMVTKSADTIKYLHSILPEKFLLEIC